jgi:hypothetical protein
LGQFEVSRSVVAERKGHAIEPREARGRRALVFTQGEFRMRTLKPLMLVVALTLTFSAAASAQACLGLPSFRSGPVHLTVAGEFPDSATGYVAGLGAGRPDGLFANAGVGRVSYVGLEEKSSLGFLEFGLQVPMGRFQFCPIVGGYLGLGPDDALAGLEVTSRAATGGGALGVALEMGSIGLVPNVAVKYEYLSQKVSEEGLGSASYTYDYTTLDLGLALLVRDRVGIQPVAHVPLSGEDGEVSFGIFASFALGRW